MSDWSTPDKVYLIKDKNGNFAPRTKIYPSKSGAKNGKTSFIMGELSSICQEKVNSEELWDINHIHTCYLKGPDRRVTLKTLVQPCRKSSEATQEDIDEYYSMLADLDEKWTIEEIKQNYGD